jgi:uncharacterized protein YjbJ (UPF0337 family)
VLTHPLRNRALFGAGNGRCWITGAQLALTHVKESIMNKDHVKGEAEKLKGKANEVAGKITGDKGQELKGDMQQAAGEARKAMGDVKDAVKHGSDNHAHRK